MFKKKPLPPNTYDVVVIGAGSGGLTTAVGFQKVGKKVLLVEREHMGGECTNTGCVPSKALLHVASKHYNAAVVAGSTRMLGAYRKEVFPQVRAVIDSFLEEEQPETFQNMGIDVAWGDAEFLTPYTIKVADEIFEFKKAVIASGSSPRPLPIKGVQDADILTNQNIFQLDKIPAKLLVIGGGPIGMEMAHAFAMLGSEVTIATIDDTVGHLEDEAVRPFVQKVFEDLGVNIITNAFIKGALGKEAVFDIKENDAVIGQEKVPFDKILIAIGRVPNIPRGIAEAGIDASRQGIVVDSQFRTTNRRVYAVGDVAQRLKFTHTADNNARGIVAHSISHGLLRIKHNRAVPKVTFLTPEIAQTGLSWEEATKKFGEANLMRIEVPLTTNDRAKSEGRGEEGVLVIIAKRLRGTIVGAHAAAPHAGELIATLTVAIDHKVSLWKLRSTIFAYPTYSLAIKKAGDYFFAQQIASLKPDIRAWVKRAAPKIIAGLFWFFILYSFHSYRVENALSYRDVLFNIVDFFTTSAWGPVIYMVLYAIRPIILFPATLLTALSGALFGLWGGIFYTILGENASANLAYFIGRFFGKDLHLEDSIIGTWVTALREKPFASVLFMRLFYVPFDLTNYASGILKLPWRHYALATVIGIMPGLTTFVALGAAVDLDEFRMNGISAEVFDIKFLFLSVFIFIVSLAASRMLQKRRASMQTEEAA